MVLSRVIFERVFPLRLESWWARRDLNPQPRDYESPALTVELQALLIEHHKLAADASSRLHIRHW